MDMAARKAAGAYYTPDGVVRSLVNWAVRSSTDRLLDPSCGDGRFLLAHRRSVGVEQDPQAAAIVHSRSPGSLIHQGDFFAWAERTAERFECAAGNPPFIRYQRFSGTQRENALRVCGRVGAVFNGLTSSWAPFLVATANLLKPGGRMAFVVPAELGHAPYARPALEYLLENFESVHVIAPRAKLFPELSEDCWLLFCTGFGGRSSRIKFSPVARFRAAKNPPREGEDISTAEWEAWGGRLRPCLLTPALRTAYRQFACSKSAARLSAFARIGIGYVTGANDFFHLRPSTARLYGIPKRFLQPAVRQGRDLSGDAITNATVKGWHDRDEPRFLLRLQAGDRIPGGVAQYLDSPGGREARKTYKCRNRDPWYAVPDVRSPQGFLAYMCSEAPVLVANEANCVGTNSVHVVELKAKADMCILQRLWKKPWTQLSCEIEGHPLGGGMLKLEPREASRIVLDLSCRVGKQESQMIEDGVQAMRQWRHRDG